jgi:TolB-like protein
MIPSVTESSHSVFLSYASQDAESAQKICAALRAAGIEVFLDQSELRGGDVWDQKIRREIDACSLFIPVISANTAERHEGYFRLEWDLADQRTHRMARNRVFIVPVCLDTTAEAGADVPESFRRAQWTRLPGGDTPAAFIERIRRLLSPDLVQGGAVSGTTPGSTRGVTPGGVPPPGEAARAYSRLNPVLLALVGVVVCAGLAYLLADRFRASRQPASSVGQPAPPPTVAPASAAAAAAAGFTPPPHSIAVLPFVNMSGDKDQEYFSDGLTEELLNSLAAISGLQVAARTSSFSFKGKDTDIGTIARKLNVSAVLEGSVRRSAHTVRITAQLIDAVTGFHLWSKSYDRDLGDVLKLQTQIATAVADALEVTLLSDASTRIELGGTRNPAAFDAYLHATKATDTLGADNYLLAVAAYTEAIRLDPNYALAFAGRSFVQSLYASQYAQRSVVRRYFDSSLADANEATALAPELADGHAALGFYMANGALDLTQARKELERAHALAPGNAHILGISGLIDIMTGRTETGLADLQHAVKLDPLNANSYHVLGFGSYLAHRYEQAHAANAQAISLDPELLRSYEYSGLTDYQLGNFSAARATCEARPNYWGTQWCLALAYRKLGLHAEAQTALSKIQDMQGDAAAYQYSTIYAQWGDTPKALEWLEAALRLRDPGLSLLKTDPLMTPLRNEPRYQVVERELKFPD